MSAAFTAVCDVPTDHPAFAGHFPGRPIWPGVLLLAEVMEALRAAPALAAALGERPSIAAAKFLAPVRPASQLDIALTTVAGSAAVGFEVRCGATLVASGRLVAVEEAA